MLSDNVCLFGTEFLGPWQKNQPYDYHRWPDEMINGDLILICYDSMSCQLSSSLD